LDIALIVSTFWLSEIEGLIQDGLKKMCPSGERA